MARMLQEPLTKILGQPVIVDNRPGAAGAIGSREVATAPPDGYTLVFSNNGPTSIAPTMQKDAGYDSLKSFAPVSLVAVAPLVLAVHASVPADNVADFIAYTKKQPEGLFYSSAGPGSLGHLSTELFAARAGIKLNHVPYKGQAPATTALLTGDVKVFFSTINQTLNDFVQEKKIKMLGISSAEPSPVVPNVRPIGEAVKGYAVDVWFGILAPAKTPAPVIEQAQCRSRHRARAGRDQGQVRGDRARSQEQYAGTVHRHHRDRSARVGEDHRREQHQGGVGRTARRSAGHSRSMRRCLNASCRRL